MAVLKCKMCGATLTVNEEEKIVQCRYCESMQTLPNLDDELKMKLFDRATELRLACDFDQAAGVFQGIIAQFPEEAEAYWGLVLCKYGIEYVDDPRDGKKVPTCHRTRSQSVLLDTDYAAACEYAQAACWKYEEEAQVIDSLQQKILAISRAEEPYDVFICYKETDDVTRVRTEDSMTAQDIYTELTTKGYKVFYSRVTLRGKAGSEYEPYIYAALSSAKVMLVIGSKKEYFEAVWLKNEWSRYLGMMDDGDKVLIPCYETIEPEQRPRRLRGFQALNIHDVMFWPNLFTNIERVIEKTPAAQPAAPTATAVSNDVAPLLRRAELFLEDGDWQGADDYCEKVLDIDPECAKAYVIKLLVENKAKTVRQIAVDFENDPHYCKAIRFADEALKAELEAALVKAKQAQEQARLEAEQKAQEEFERKQRMIQLRKQSKMCSQLIAAGSDHTVGLRANGTVVAMGDNKDAHQWRNIVAIAAGIRHTVGLKADGTIVAVGNNIYGQCDVHQWRNIIAITAGAFHTVGLEADGAVVVVGNSEGGRCNVSAWNNITKIAAGDYHTVGLKEDGKVIAVGNNMYDQCGVHQWKDIVAITAGAFHTVGLKADGTVVAVGNNEGGRCNVSAWRNITAIAAGISHTVGLNEDGTVIAIGNNSFEQCDVVEWKDIVAIAAGRGHTVGLRADGTVIAVGDNKNGQCNVSDWDNVVAVTAGGHSTVGLKADGTIVAVGKNEDGQCNVGMFRLFDDLETLEDTLEQTKRDGIAQLKSDAGKRTQQEHLRREQQERLRREEQERQNRLRAERRAQGVCQYCGGEFKGLFIKKCICCGKTKDY